MANAKTSALATDIMKVLIPPAVTDMRKRAADVVKDLPAKTKAERELIQRARKAILALPLEAER